MIPDAKVTSTFTPSNSFPVWDWEQVGNIVPLTSGKSADSQAALICSYIQLGTIPQLPDQGVPWMEFLAGNKPFTIVDSAIKTNLLSAGLTGWTPDYTIVGGGVSVTMRCAV